MKSSSSRFTFYVMKDCDIIQALREYDVQETVIISTPKYFRIYETDLPISKWGDGTQAGSLRAFFLLQ